MEEFVYNAYARYFGFLEMNGYYSQKDVDKLLVLTFIYDLIYRDYRGNVKEEDYHVFERALECLYGTSCLTPYMDYLKMGKLKLGEMTEVLHRTHEAERVVRDMEHAVRMNRRRIDRNTEMIIGQGMELAEIAETKVVKGKTLLREIPDLDLADYNSSEKEDDGQAES